MPVAQLDYEPKKLVMQADTAVEQSFRLHAVGKEPFTVAFIESIPQGGVFWDIGANVGPYTLIAASRGILTVAVEPASPNFLTLMANLKANMPRAFAPGTVIPLKVGVDHGNGVGWLNLHDMQSGAASYQWGDVPQHARQGFGYRELVPVFTIDSLVGIGLPCPTHIKIDVDGGELGVLQGASETLDAGTLQHVMIEMASHEHEVALTTELALHGFTLAERHDIRGISYGRFTRS